MKTFDFDWGAFIKQVPTWKLLSMPCREFCLFHCGTNRRMLLRDISIDATPLLDKGFLEHAANPSYVKLRRSCLPFQRIMRIMARNSPFFDEEKVHAKDLQAYLDAHFSRPDQLALGGRVTTPSRRISQISWLDAFLRAESFRVWEYAHKSELRTKRVLFDSDDCFQKTRQIVSILMRGRNPLPFSDLADALGSPDLADHAASIRAGIAYALLFPAVNNRDLIPVIGIWPGIHERLHRPKMPRPSASASVEQFQRAYMMDDMTTLLVACAGKPLRLREYAREMYATDAKKVAANLSPLPTWLKPLSPCGDKSRIETAQDTLTCMEMTETVRQGGQEWLVPGKQGHQWLVLSQRERLRAILDTLRERAEQEAALSCSDLPGLPSVWAGRSAPSSS